MVVMLTPDLGKITVSARGSRKLKSGYGAALEPMTKSDVLIDYRPEKDVQQIRSADTTDFFGGMKASFVRSTVANACCEMIDHAIADPERMDDVYHSLCSTLEGLDCDEDTGALRWFWWLSLKLATALGYAPELSACMSCGLESPEHPRLAFDVGGVMCAKCADSARTRTRFMSPAAQQFLAKLSISEPCEVGRIDVVNRLEKEVTQHLESYLKYHLPAYRRVRSLDLLPQFAG